MNVNANLHSTTSLSLLASVFVLGAFPSGPATATPPDVETIELTGIVRDFLPSHTDFDVVPDDGWGHYMWNIAPDLGDANNPSFVGGGSKVDTQCLDSTARPICWTLYDPDLGDTPGVPGNADTGGITSAATFGQWFHDVPGVNMSAPHTVIGIKRDEGLYAGMYEVNIPQFYPIDGMLFGDGTDRHNIYFTFEIVATFTYDAAANHEFMFKSDDDVWVFLDGKMIADLGGMNGSPEQWVDLSRLGLVDGQTYSINFFKTNRSDSGHSRFHLVTNIQLFTPPLPTISAAFD